MLNAALELLMRGKPLIAIGRNRRFRNRGRWLLDGDAFVQALEYGAGCEAVVMGKPAPALFQEVLASLGRQPAEVLMVGDDVKADLAVARALGLQAALVQTGKFSASDRQRLPAGACLWAELRELLPLLEG
jgi:ribonucleotide monophosphatase NagD (HAD superfamily)